MATRRVSEEQRVKRGRFAPSSSLTRRVTNLLHLRVGLPICCTYERALLPPAGVQSKESDAGPSHSKISKVPVIGREPVPLPIETKEDVALEKHSIVQFFEISNCRGSIVFLILVLLDLGCNPKPIPVAAPQTLNGRTMGTTYSVKIVPYAEMPSLLQISSKVQSELEQVNEQMSTYMETSELSRFNQQQTTDWFPVSPETAQAVTAARAISEKTDGGFDVTVGPLVRLWGFGPGGRPETIPTDEQVSQALENTGYRKLEVRSKPPALRKTEPNLQVDLSAIAKGQAVDRVASTLTDLGCTAFLVEIGGEVRARGRKIDGQPWYVGIEQPKETDRSVQLVIGLDNQCLATSGDYRNFYEVEGQRYSHTIIPSTGYPSQDEIASASVVADSCELADAIATSMMSVGFQRGMELAEQHDWAVLLMSRQGDAFSSSASSRFSNLFPDAGSNAPAGQEPHQEPFE